MFRIEKIDAFAIAVPLKKPVKMSQITIETADNLIVCVTDNDGNTGWGEGSSAPTMTGETPEGMLAAAKFMIGKLTGKEVGEPSQFHELIEPLMYGNHGAKAAIEIALLDLAGKRLGKPLYELLGGKKRESADILTMVAGGTLETELANAKADAERGFRAFKVKVGVNSAQRDLERSRAVRDALGRDVRISADANQGYSPDEAMVFANGASDAGLTFIEQLVRGEDVASMARCAQASRVPLGADEGFHSMADIRHHHEMKAAAGGSLKTIKLGGAFPVMNAAHLMVSLGMHINLAGKIADTSINSAAIAHLALALPQNDWDTSITNQYLADDVVSDPLKIVNGSVTLSDAPGLGVTPDDAKLAKYRSLS